MRSSSTRWTRLALALLALAGYAAPAAERELDGVVQTTRAGRDELVVVAAPVVEALCLSLSFPPRAQVSSREGSFERRYLLHRAWLL